MRNIKDNNEYGSEIKKILNNATLMGLHKNKKFLATLFDKFHITMPGHASSNKEKVKADFFTILDLFEAKYKDQADLGFHYDEDKNIMIPYFKVIYPKFTITNSQGRSHVIKDLIVCHTFKFGNGCVYPSNLWGTRLSKTHLEVLSGYNQSHLPRQSDWANTSFYCQRFCIGSDTDVSRMLAEFEVEMDLDRYELFLFCVDSMVTWESLEGVPYIKMEVITNAGSDRVTGVSDVLIDKVVKTIIEEKLPLDVDFYLDEGIYKILPNERAGEFVKKIVIRKVQFEESRRILVSRVPNTYDNYLMMKTDSSLARSTSKINSPDYIIFRGKKVYPRIIKEDSRTQVAATIEDYIVYPKFLKNVIRKLEYRIYEKAVVKNATKLFNTRSDASRSVASDTVSVQINF
jgi:hypothetical protein